MPTTVNDIPYAFITGGTFSLQKQLEAMYGSAAYAPSYNGLRGYLVPMTNLKKETFIGIIDKYEYELIDYLDPEE